MSGENHMHTSKRRKLPANVWLLCFVSFFADISSEMMYPLLPLFVIGVLGANEIQLGAMEGAAVLLVSLIPYQAINEAKPSGFIVLSIRQVPSSVSSSLHSSFGT